ncbi:MAG TPA: tRNA pseudouridine(55) synthase TruB [Pseudomonadales bacterium]|nr:tRNA pseudouridine(55) synthase TruB [Pseudomonadales bacterium]
MRAKVGHLGTLDPFATGVLPLCVGEGTKIAQFLNAADKTYAGVMQLGAETDTGDKTGRVTRRAPVPTLGAETLHAVAQRFVGEQLQTPPMFSAIKQEGVPLYKLARRGEEVAREPRRVVMHRLVLRASGDDTIAFDVHCSKGTYVRVLAQDIGAALGSAAHLSALRRTRFGRFTLDGAIGIDDLRGGRIASVIGLREALSDLPEIEVDRDFALRARRGQQWALEALAQPAEDSAKLVGPDGELVAVISSTADRRWQFARVFGAGSR